MPNNDNNETKFPDNDMKMRVISFLVQTFRPNIFLRTCTPFNFQFTKFRK